ncbi:hypothetical protein GBA52_015431 [Prunus armeniaca]|nr:hypothetical protein GBA52_015431 [Prunus armeniaca]
MKRCHWSKSNWPGLSTPIINQQTGLSQEKGCANVGPPAFFFSASSAITQLNPFREVVNRVNKSHGRIRELNPSSY